ncbi:MAG: glutamine-hydrolyzing carbamoyl-phosphate synthase small subunit [Bdellovibrionales bacterium]|nr:glutamine-hydrolyzing carbamoyl-phosphate synthase small subunit [Bdellovibrionales bacterium]
MAFLVLETGQLFPGHHLGGGEKAGEVVFNTAHSGYEEVATDPSYFSQIVVMTAPHQGNYSESDAYWESDNIWIEGLICLKMQNSPRDVSWKDKLIRHSVPVLDGVDTRLLTLTLRNHGSIYGAIVSADSEDTAQKKAQALIQKSKSKEKDWPYLISTSKPTVHKGKIPGGPRMAVLDFGCKNNILRELFQRCSEVKVFPSRATIEDIEAWKPDGILLSNGPGDPAYVQVAVDTVKSLIGRYFMFGICMGCQILALALGGKTRKLKFGHRGVNHPVKDLLHDQIYITSQNHGYVIVEGSLPSDVQVTHVNLNDQTIQGFFSENKKILAVQFHPENHPGPEDSVFLFDRFIQQCSNLRKV